MSFDFAAAQAQLASINGYSGETITLGAAQVKAHIDLSRAGEVLMHGGTELRISCTAVVSKAQLGAKPAQKTTATVRGENVRVIEVGEDSLSYLLTFGWAFSL